MCSGAQDLSGPVLQSGREGRTRPDRALRRADRPCARSRRWPAREARLPSPPGGFAPCPTNAATFTPSPFASRTLQVLAEALPAHVDVAVVGVADGAVPGVAGAGHRRAAMAALSDDLGGDALVDLALRPAVDQQREVGVRVQVDEPGAYRRVRSARCAPPVECRRGRRCTRCGRLECRCRPGTVCVPSRRRPLHQPESRRSRSVSPPEIIEAASFLHSNRALATFSRERFPGSASILPATGRRPVNERPAEGPRLFKRARCLLAGRSPMCAPSPRGETPTPHAAGAHLRAGPMRRSSRSTPSVLDAGRAMAEHRPLRLTPPRRRGDPVTASTLCRSVPGRAWKARRIGARFARACGDGRPLPAASGRPG